MKGTIIRSLAIAITLGIIFSIVVNTLMATTVATDYLEGTRMFLTGIDAVKDIIKTTGLISFILLCVGQFIFYFLAVFLGCVWLGYWSKSRDVKY